VLPLRQGNYTIPQLPVGQYVVTVTLQGFKTFRAQNVFIAATQTVRLDVHWRLEAPTDSVTVTTDASLAPNR